MTEFSDPSEVTDHIFGPDTADDIEPPQSSTYLNIKELVQDFDTAQRILAYRAEHPGEPPIDPLSGLPGRVELQHGVIICVVNGQTFQAPPTPGGSEVAL